MQDFYYNESGNLIQVQYTLPSGARKEQNLTYTALGNVVSFEEIN